MRKLAVLVVTLGLCFGLCGCSSNYDIIDTTYRYDYAYIELQNGEIVEGEIESWRDYGDGDQIQVTLKGGDTYLVHSCDITLISKND